MLSLLERNIASIEDRLVLLAPPTQTVPGRFRNVVEDTFRRDELFGDMQKLRGGIYLADGAIRPDQLSDGRHQTPEDERAWHLLMMNNDNEISSCAWFMDHQDPQSVADLRAGHCPLTKDADWKGPLNEAIDTDIRTARREGLRYAEVGGWAVSKESRCTAEGLVLALATWGLGRFFGGAIGLTTATVRHGSSTILRRLGGGSLQAAGVTVPAYFDAKYGCDMELLRFDSRKTNTKYDGIVDLLTERLSRVQVFAASETRMATSAAHAMSAVA